MIFSDVNIVPCGPKDPIIGMGPINITNDPLVLPSEGMLSIPPMNIIMNPIIINVMPAIMIFV